MSSCSKILSNSSECRLEVCRNTISILIPPIPTGQFLFPFPFPCIHIFIPIAIWILLLHSISSRTTPEKQRRHQNTQVLWWATKLSNYCSQITQDCYDCKLFSEPADKLVRRFSIILPATLKTLSLAADVAGMQRTVLTTANKSGNKKRLSFQNSTISTSLSISY